ncbi:MAG: glycosyltransferase family 2 protein [Gammaproteobacteria bacterium]|nr:glycosyltransferase family 2 protein [Gammaproteobacteria bacterium]MCF6261819.1 glycosyltransferase family 2 protein [Gammaproteobacteria bacterium]
MTGYFIYFLLLVAAALSLPAYYFDPAATQFVLALGLIAIWRYGWAITHFTRALIFRKIVFPKWRRQTIELGAAADPSHVFFLLTTFRIGTDVTTQVYREAFKEAIRCNLPVTIVVSIVEMSEEKIIKTIFHAHTPPSRVKLKIVRISGTGKRDALAAGFRAIASTPVDKSTAVASVIDGDSILAPGSTLACARLFALNPKLGALTTDEVCNLLGDDFITGIYRRWYSMRFAQRHVYMSSMGLSRRVLTLTGRMSMFRASLISDADFISGVQHDHINHWRLGRFRFLTGDDKSSWYHLLKNGWEMWYVPDVQVITIEEPPHPNFFIGANTLMRRWFGNMLRTNSRALKVPRKTMGTFVWWNLLDQRISMWTSLFGLCAAIIGASKFGITLLLMYAWWIAFTRYSQALMLLSSRKKISITWPFLIYFNQIYGSLVKIYVLSHLSKQKWTRQKTTLAQGGNKFDRWYQQSSSNVSVVAYLILFVTGVTFVTGVFSISDIYQYLLAVGDQLDGSI